MEGMSINDLISKIDENVNFYNEGIIDNSDLYYNDDIINYDEI